MRNKGPVLGLTILGPGAAFAGGAARRRPSPPLVTGSRAAVAVRAARPRHCHRRRRAAHSLHHIDS
eukprot:2227350-Pyramimonas_sp.AAC.1